MRFLFASVAAYPKLCVWIDARTPEVDGDAVNAWLALEGDANSENVTVMPFWRGSNGPEDVGERAWRWAAMVGRLARSDERCAWTMLVTTSTFVFLPAVQERLACMNEQEPLVFGRLAGRMNPKYPRIGGIPTPVPWLSAGIVISAGALEVHQRG